MLADAVISRPPQRAQIGPSDVPDVDWADDYQHRTNPTLFTDLLRQAVPALDAVQWQVLETDEGYARSVLPLVAASTNHQGTHQGALMLLAADYTGGVALATLFRGFPVVGVHAQPHDWPADRAAMWLAKADISYAVPSTADLIATCRVPADQFGSIQRRFLRGATVLVPLVVELHADGVRVATATLTYFARRSSFLRPQTASERPNGLYLHQVKASARLVAGLRAGEQASDSPGFRDPYSTNVAGEHGRLLADQFARVLPELQALVAARTQDADACVDVALARGIRQVVFLGVGLDCRPFRLLADHPDVAVFELDLPGMLQERARVLESVPDAGRVRRQQVGIDFNHDDVADVLARTDGFNPALPTLFLQEGVSMYLDAAANARFFRSVAKLMAHPDSRLWLDIVTQSVVDGSNGHPGLNSFVSRMARLGEPFVFGLDEAAVFFAPLGLDWERCTPASTYQPNHDNPIFDLYRFYVLRRSPRPAGCHILFAGDGQPAAG